MQHTVDRRHTYALFQGMVHRYAATYTRATELPYARAYPAVTASEAAHASSIDVELELDAVAELDALAEVAVHRSTALAGPSPHVFLALGVWTTRQEYHVPTC